MSTAILAATDLETTSSPDVLPVESDESLHEWINGRRVEMPPMSIRAVAIVSRLCTTLNAFAGPRQLGEAYTEMLIQISAGEESRHNRRPDVCFISSARLAVDGPEDFDDDAWRVVPDLAIEVTSPTDRAEVQREKVQEYLGLGVPNVWVIYPRLRLVDVYDLSGNLRTFGPAGVLPADPCLPGLMIPLDELFRPIGPPGE